MPSYRNISFCLIFALFFPFSVLFAEIIDDLEEIDDGDREEQEELQETVPKKSEKPKQKSKPSQEGPAKKDSGKKPKKKKSTESDAERKKQPIELKSDGEAVYSKNGGVVHLVENVRITQGNLFFRSDEAKAFFVEIAGEHVVEKVEIFGNVKVAKYSEDPTENIKASGNQAVYLNSIGLVTLTGNARLWQGGHLIKGKKITYELSTGIIKVDRAEGVVTPEDAKNQSKKEFKDSPQEADKNN